MPFSTQDISEERCDFYAGNIFQIGVNIGQIIIDKGIVKFEGNFDESAKTFIDFVAKRWSEQWKDLEKRA
ncbi:hypothetical protein ACSLNR_29630, partial [Escherichia coli]